MTKRAHIARHVELHQNLDELLADYLVHNPGKYPSKLLLMDLMKWAYQQTLDPTPTPGVEYDPEPPPPPEG